MRAGPLRFRLQVQQPVITSDAVRAPKKEWTNVGDWVWAEIAALSAREYFSAENRDVGSPYYRIVIRNMPGVKLEPSMRGIDLDNGTIFDFTAELPSAKRDMWTFAAVSGKGAS